MNDIVANFHFLRPTWFYAIVPAVILFLVLRARFARGSNWAKTVDAELLPYLLEAPGGTTSRLPLTLLLVGWLIACLALAGPVWKKLPQPVHERQDALVIILDLTRSMYSVDVKPNRLVQARRKLTDLLDARKEGVTGLIVFSGDAHAVSPLTDDAKTIEAMIPALGPEIMPAPGSRVTPALQRAYQLFKDGGAPTGRILLITDEIRDMGDAERVAREHRADYPVSVMSVGTAQGAPISADRLTANGGYLKDESGNLVIPKVDFGALQDFASEAGGRFSRMTLTDADLTYLLGDTPLPDKDQFRTLQRDFDVWAEEGPWLLLLLLPLGALAFRRGWIWCLLPLLVTIHSPRAEASMWDDLWQTRDQQAAEALKQGDAARAADLFKDPAWRATARYKDKDYGQAAKDFGGVDTSDGHYNQGNALAHAGKLEDALKAYDQALTMNPGNKDATYNKQIVEQLLKQQQEQQNKNGKGNNSKNSKQQDSQQKQSSQGSDQQQNANRQNQRTQDENGAQDQDENEQAKAQQQKQKQQADQAKAEQEKKQQQMAQADKDKQQGDKKQPAAADDHLTDEQRQALQQWLRRVPDDPGGLLRRKFALQHEQRLKNGELGPDDSRSNW